MLQDPARGRHVAAPRAGVRVLRRVAGLVAGTLAVALVMGAAVFHRLQGNITATDITGVLGNLRPESSASTDPSTSCGR